MNFLCACVCVCVLQIWSLMCIYRGWGVEELNDVPAWWSAQCVRVKGNDTFATLRVCGCDGTEWEWTSWSFGPGKQRRSSHGAAEVSEGLQTFTTLLHWGVYDQELYKWRSWCSEILFREKLKWSVHPNIRPFLYPGIRVSCYWQASCRLGLLTPDFIIEHRNP